MTGAVVRDYMSRPVCTIGPEAPLDEAQALFEARDISSLAVVDASGELVGVVSRTDLLSLAAPGREVVLDFWGVTVAQVMSRPALVVGSGTEVRDACAQMVQAHVHRLYVVEDGVLSGVFGTRDAMNALIARRLAIVLEAYMSFPVLTVAAETSIGEALLTFREAHVSGLVVTDGEWPVGLFTQREALEARGRSPDDPVEQVMTASMVCLQQDFPLYRAAAFAVATRARRVLALHGRHVSGLLSGLDFCRALAELP